MKTEGNQVCIAWNRNISAQLLTIEAEIEQAFLLIYYEVFFGYLFQILESL